MKRLKTFLMSFLVVMSMAMFTGDALAVPPTNPLPADGSAPFVLAENDYFIGVLLKGFLGDIINTSSTSADTTVKASGKLGEVFRTFNLGVAFFGTLLVLFITIIGVLQSGQDGEFLGKKWSSMWVPIRFALGSVLMLPLTASGYSFVQALVLWIAMQGVGFADSIWATIVDTMVKQSTVAQVWGNIPAESISRNMMSSALCATAVNSFTKGGLAPVTVSFKPEGEVSGKGGMTTATWRWGDVSPQVGPESDKYAICGKFTYTYEKPVNGANFAATGAFSDQFSGARTDLIKMQKTVIEEMAERFLRASTSVDLVTALKEPGDHDAEIKGYEDTINQEVYLAAADYQSRMTKAADDALVTYGGTDQSARAELMKKYGFVSAGVFYIELARLNSAVTNQISATPKYTGPNVTSVTSLGNGSTSFETLFTYFQSVNSDISKAAIDAKAEQLTYDSAGTGKAKTIDNGNIFPDKVDLIKSPSGAMDMMATSMSAKFVRVLVGVGTDSNGGGSKLGFDRHLTNDQASASNNTGSAILQLKNRGDLILDWAAAFYIAKATLDAALAFSDSNVVSRGAQIIYGGGGGYSAAAIAFVSGLAPALMSVAGGLFAFGFTLAVYLPMVPYVLWIGGIVGLLVLIAESLVASALWAVMLIHPSGEGLTSDQSRQGVMMLLVLFSRPALMLMGMIMGMFMIDPLVMLVNDTFFYAMTSLQKGTGFTGLFSTIAYAVVYMSLVISIINRCFSMIHTVPDRVLRWIGGGDAQLGESHARDDAKGMSSMAAGAVGGAVGAGMSAMGRKQVQGRVDKAQAAAAEAAAAKKAAANTNGSLLPKS